MKLYILCSDQSVSSLYIVYSLPGQLKNNFYHLVQFSVIIEITSVLLYLIIIFTCRNILATKTNITTSLHSTVMKK